MPPPLLPIRRNKSMRTRIYTPRHYGPIVTAGVIWALGIILWSYIFLAIVGQAPWPITELWANHNVSVHYKSAPDPIGDLIVQLGMDI